jgi:hypothetical protein
MALCSQLSLHFVTVTPSLTTDCLAHSNKTYIGSVAIRESPALFHNILEATQCF